MITLHQVHKFYGKQDVLKGASMHIGPRQRLGLVGPNGAGKSTLLNIMLGNIEPDQGDVFRAKGLRVGYLPQDLLALTGQTVLELAMDTGNNLEEVEKELTLVHDLLAGNPENAAELLERQGQLQSIFENLGGYDLEARASKVLAGLGFRPEQLGRDVSNLSGGWLMRAALARIILSAPDVILLDEPTNHLDLESLLWLENHLVTSPSSLMLVSHDRIFLDKVVNRIVELDQGRLIVYGGNYTDYEAQRVSRIKAQEAAYVAQQERIREIQNFIERNRSRKSSAKQVQSRIKMLETMEMLSPPESDEVLELTMPDVDRSAKVVVELIDANLTYGQRPVYRELNFVLQRGDRMALLGRNGAGKSSLLKLLTGQVQAQSGRRLVGGRVNMGIFSQHALQDLNPENDVLGELGSVAGHLSISRLRTVLGTFLFKGDEVFKKVKVLSGGERSRLVLAKILINAPNALFMDEPTNHLDLHSRQVLEKALAGYQGTLVLVSHDRHLINACANKVVWVDDGRLTVCPGNYDDFERLWRKGISGQAPAPAAAPTQDKAAPKETKDNAEVAARKNSERKRQEAARRNALYQKLKPLRDEFSKVEADLEVAHKEMDELVLLMSDAGAYADGERWQNLSGRHKKLQDRIERLSGRWEELGLALEEQSL